MRNSAGAANPMGSMPPAFRKSRRLKADFIAEPTYRSRITTITTAAASKTR